jgi:N-acetylneuraminic acid mutarotase
MELIGLKWFVPLVHMLGTKSRVPMKTQKKIIHVLALVLALAATVVVTRPARAAFWITNSPMAVPRGYGHTATLLPNGQLLVAGGFGNAGCLSSAEVCNPATGTWTTIGAMASARENHTATLLPNGQVLVAGGEGSSGYVLSGAELYNPVAGTWTATAGTMLAARENHTATVLPNGLVLVTGGYGSSGFLSSAELYNPTNGTWVATGSMKSVRENHTATLLPNGRVLVAGGFGSAGFLSSAEFYDPAAGTWTKATGMLTSSRENHTATLLPNGQVLVAGGFGSDGFISTSELYDSAAGTWTISTMVSARENHTATLLPNGQVLVTGGFSSAGYLSSAEQYIPTSGIWTATSNTMTSARENHTATMLPSGRVLVAGGQNGTSGSLSSVELFDPTSAAWTVTGAGSTPSCYFHTATLLTNAEVLVAGGYNYSGGDLHNSAVFNPVAGQWTATGYLRTARYGNTATLLPNGKVLVAGGYNGPNPSTSAELYDPVTRTWTPTGLMNNGRLNHIAALLPNGQVLVAGGANFTGGYPSMFDTLASAELYDPASGTWRLTGSMSRPRQYHAGTLLPTGQVLITGGTSDDYNDSPPSDYNPLASTELYDPATGTWTPTGNMTTPRVGHTATLLSHGGVLVAQGLSAEIYEPSSGTWTPTGDLITERNGHTATLLPNGEVLVTGGLGAGRPLSSAELFDPVIGAWRAAGTLPSARTYHTATLMANGKVLLVGGYGDNGNLPSSADLYDVGLGFSIPWQPQVSRVNSPLMSGGSLILNGSQFRGISEGSSGNSQDSASDYPLVQLRSVESGQTLFLLSADWSTHSFASAPVFGFPPGWTLATVFVNGIPSSSTLFLKSNLAASVAMGNLNQTYDGRAKTAAVTTTPTNLMVALTYNGSNNAPTNAGSYTVIGTISGLDYLGSATNTLIVGQATGMAILGNLSQIYDGSAKRATATTTPPGLTVNFTYNGLANPPTNADSYTVVGTIDDPNYQGSAADTLVIGRATGTMILGNLLQDYDGTAKTATATTTPPGLMVDFTYNDSANPPTNVGSYTVIGTIDDLNYQGSATNTLLIVLQLTAPTWDGNGQFTFTFATTFGVVYTVEFSTNLIDWTPALSLQGVNGPLTILDPNASSFGRRFYGSSEKCLPRRSC